jgi:[ribosomal protein S5]-alanine N-acetyltransferase
MRALAAGNLVLEPLVAAHAEAMFEVLTEPELYRYLDYPPPPTVEHLVGVYARLEARKSPDRSEHWLNWIVSPLGQPPVGYVQATVTLSGVALIGYVFSKKHWGKGYATHAVQAMVEHLPMEHGVSRFLATVEAENAASIRLLARVGFRAATDVELESHELSQTERLFIRELRTAQNAL